MNGIRIPTNVDLSVEPKDILNCIYGENCNWSILYLYAFGDIGRPISDFEAEIRTSDNGFAISWSDLLNLSTKFHQVIDIILIGDRDISKVKRYSDDKEMYDRCEYVLELIDSSYWIIHVKNEEILNKLKHRFRDVEEL